jgi:hypothetical protein
MWGWRGAGTVRCHGPRPHQPPVPRFTGVHVIGHGPVVIHGSRLALTLSSAVAARGTLTVVVRAAGHGARAFKLGAFSFRVPAGHPQLVSLRLSASAVRFLRAHRHARLALTTQGRTALGTTASVSSSAQSRWQAA